MGHKPPIPDKVSPEGKDFLCHCLESDPKMRWTASQLLDHPFVKVCLMTLATKTADGNWEQLLVSFFVFRAWYHGEGLVAGRGLATFQKPVLFLASI